MKELMDKMYYIKKLFSPKVTVRDWKGKYRMEDLTYKSIRGKKKTRKMSNGIELPHKRNYPSEIY